MNKTNGSERDRTHGEVKWPLFQDMQNKVQTAVTNNSFQPSDFPLEKNNHIAHLSHTYTLPKGIDEDTLRNGLKYKDDVKFLYAMMRLKEKLEQTAGEKDKDEQIDELKKKL